MFSLFRRKPVNAMTKTQYYDLGKVNNYSNSEIVKALKQYHNIDFVSVQRLNKVLEGMGVIERSNGRWLLTEYGRVRFTELNDCVYSPTLWNKGIVDAVASYCKSNKIV